MKVLVTGGAGFIGSHIVDRLVEQSHNVTIVDDLSTGSVENINKKAEFHKLDIRSESVCELFRTRHFDCVIHQAAQTAVSASLVRPDFDCDVNVLGTINLLEACRATGVKRFIFASTAAVYGNGCTVPVQENANLHPSSFYGLSKLTCEKYLSLYHQIFGLEYIIFRYANVYGERQGDCGEGGVVSIFTRQIAAGVPIKIFGDGGQTRDFIYVGDIADANIAAVTHPLANQIYNVGTSTELSVNTLAQSIETIAAREIQKQYLAAREGDIYNSALDNTKITTQLGWQPRTSLQEGLARTYNMLGKRS